MTAPFRCHVYMVRCKDGSLYTGWAIDVARRVAAHNAGSGARYTRARLPVQLVFAEPCAGKAQALRREAQIKKMTKSQKERLVHTFAAHAPPVGDGNAAAGQNRRKDTGD